jgi:uncharacterized protein YndB with AHSA1/START domain
MRKVLSLAAALCAAAGVALAQPTKTPDVVDTSFATADGARTLQESIVIDAPVAILWKAFADSEEFKRWNSPVAAVDLRVGGSLEASYDPKRKLGDPDNIKHRIITFLPERLIVFQNIQAPHELPHADRFQKTVIVLQYEPLAPSRTRVVLSCTGWGADPESDVLYRFFHDDNAELLQKMKTVYETR